MEFEVSEKLKKICIVTVLILLYTGLFLPYLLSIPYSLPACDDFSMAAGIDTSVRILSSVRFANYAYMELGGGIWIAKVFECLLNPIAGRSVDTAATGITLFLYFLIFVLSLQFFFRSLFRYEWKMKTTLLREILLFIATAIPLSGAVYNEVFYWFSGATYGIFMSLFFLYGGFLFCYYGTREKKYLCLLVIIGTLCCMNLPYSLPVIMLYLTVILKYSKDRNEFFRKLILLVLFICGASVYLLSPGVKRRSELVGSADLSLKNLLIACRNDVAVLLMRAFEIFTRYPIQIYMLLLVFLIGTMGRSKGSSSEEEAAGIKKSIRQFVLYLIFGGVAVFGAVYPVVLGYASSSLPNRICFLADIYLMIYLIGVMYLLGCLLKRALHIKWTRPGYVVAAFLFVVELYTGTVVNEKFLLSAPIRIAADLSEIKAEHDAWTGILLEAERSGEREVLIRHSRINDTGVLKSPDLWEDETWWVNRAVGRYLGKDSVKITWSE